MARTVHTTAAKLRLGDYVTTGAGSAHGVVETMTQLASLPRSLPREPATSSPWQTMT